MVDKIIDPNVAAKAYINSGRVNQAGIDSDGDGKFSFADMVREKARESIGVMRESEKVSAQAVTGEADITDVVQAVNSAELTLQTVVAVRDRMVSAYQEIMRMPI
ncbi:MAG: hypothetical protein CBB87_11930 [Micavibrio sp. TMED27]|nr:flagellar hook-basal body complex protein FliE [Micavibrio sp.]OUT89677.1 MAG: hypothetical protein CBB87_11930 [Micavibrio sp. TMED27]|tara:strand:+ start:221 stop:535 length:315 start_codon:yes stop_codon:yes gene_type:complete